VQLTATSSAIRAEQDAMAGPREHRARMAMAGPREHRARTENTEYDAQGRLKGPFYRPAHHMTAVMEYAAAAGG
jgi:hypothetical protein